MGLLLTKFYVFLRFEIAASHPIREEECVPVMGDRLDDARLKKKEKKSVNDVFDGPLHFQNLVLMCLFAQTPFPVVLALVYKIEYNMELRFL